MRAQLSIEFIVLIGFALLTVTVFAYAISGMIGEKVDDKLYNKFNDYGISLQSEFIVASQMYPGYTRVLDIPNQLDYADYNVSVTERYIILDYISNGNEKSLYYLIPNTTGNITKGINYLRNINGSVAISNETSFGWMFVP